MTSRLPTNTFHSIQQQLTRLLLSSKSQYCCFVATTKDTGSKDTAPEDTGSNSSKAHDKRIHIDFDDRYKPTEVPGSDTTDAHPNNPPSISRLSSLAANRIRMAVEDADQAYMKHKSAPERADIGASQSKRQSELFDKEPVNSAAAQFAKVEREEGMTTEDILGIEALKEKGERPTITDIPVKP